MRLLLATVAVTPILRASRLIDGVVANGRVGGPPAILPIMTVPVTRSTFVALVTVNGVALARLVVGVGLRERVPRLLRSAEQAVEDARVALLAGAQEAVCHVAPLSSCRC